MAHPLILASGSKIRAQMLRNARVTFDTVLPRVDEDMVKDALVAEGAPPRDIADALAELKARRVSEKHPGALVLGSDQVLAFQNGILSKPRSKEEACAQIAALAGQRHQLISAAVICEEGRPVWRHVGVVRMTMRPLSDAFISDYVSRSWEDIRHCVGGYQLEAEGIRLFSGVDGDYFTVLGMPVLQVLNYLISRGVTE